MPRSTDRPSQGWESKEGDTYFQTLQQKADAAGTKAKTGFFKLMVHIGAQLNAATSAFDIKPLTSPLTPAILDLCMAPAGARPQPDRLLLALGGHEMLLPNWQTDPRIKIDFRDITILALEMGLPPLSPPLLNQPPLPAAAHPTST